MSADLTNKTIAFVISLTFLGLVLFFIVVSLVLEHHWRKYGLKSKQLQIFRLFYYLGSFVLLLPMLYLASRYFKFLTQ